MAEMMPSFQQSDDCQPKSDHISDSELPSGLPSPDASDDEDIQNCSDCGITTPYFFNKLREMTQPLFQIHQDLSPSGNGVCENVKDRSKSSRSKKRMGKENGMDSPSGIIERYYGYIPNPRWPKAQQAYTKPFNPKAIGKNDEAGISGIAFRTKSLMDHSYQESDFPELNSLSKDDSSSCIGAHSHGDSTTVVTKRRSLDHASQGCKSPVTSTPLRHECSSPCDNSILDKSDIEEVQKDDPQKEEPPYAKREMRNRSGRHNNRRRSKKIELSPLVGNSIRPPDQSLSDSSDFNSSNSFLIPQGQRSLEDLKSELNQVGRSQSLNETNNVIVTTSNKCRSDRNSGSFQASPLLSHVQTNLSAFDEQRHVQDKDNTRDHSSPNSSNFEEKHGINNNIIRSPTWSQIASRGSSPVPWNNSSEGPCIRSGSSPLTVDTQSVSPSWCQVMKSPVPSPKGLHNSKQATGITSAPMKSEQIAAKGYRSLDNKSQRKISPAAITAQSNSFSGDACKNNLRRKSGSKASSITVGNNPGDNAFSHEATKPPMLVDNSSPSLSVAKAASVHSSGKNNAAKGISAETKPCSSSDNGRGKNTTKHTTDRPSNPSNDKGTAKKGGKQRAKLLTLDNFITPKKTGKENWPNHCSKDIDAFENRFVEHIEVSATSPPKKVRPSPIKKLNFSLQGDKNSSSENDTTDGDSVVSEHGGVKGPIYKRQVSLIRDLDWQKSDSPNEGVKKTNKGKNNSSQNRRGSGVVFSLEDYMKMKEAPPKDVLSDDEIDAVEQDGSTEKEVKQFWKQKPLEAVHLKQTKSEPTLPNSSTIQQARDLGEEIYRHYPKSSAVKSDSATDKSLLDTPNVNKLEIADPSKVTFKSQLKKYARRYCHIVEEHQVASVADEIHFILQLLTPNQLNQETLKTVDLKVGWTTFRSVHNSVYFAVHTIKKLRRLFLCLPCPLLHLLAHNPRIKSFSPKLHACFMSALSSRRHENETSPPLDHNSFKSTEDGVESFPDTNFAHVFKCQRDNFYALFRQYHDRNGIHPFCMEQQIQYVYDCRTPEQNAVTNLMHLAELYVEHLIQCSLSKADEQRKQMMQLMNSQSNNESDYERLLLEFLNNQVISNSSILANRKARVDAFFVDFIQALRSPAFNEHLKNLLVSRIIELNEKSFGCVRNLHSTVIIGDDKTPERCHDFGSTVLSLCAMAKILGHLVFLPYTSGVQDLPIHQETNMLRMREMVPLPLPLPLLLKRAFEDGHLSLTVPWVVDLLSMMDQAAPKLSVYDSLLQHLQYLQRYAWRSLYMNGHHTSGLLIVSSISKVFQMAAIPSHLSIFHEEHDNEPMNEPQGGRYIDVQRLVSSDLLYFCCPQFVKSCEPLAVSVIYQNHVSLSRKVVPLIPKPNCTFTSTRLKNGKDVEEVHQRLGLSVLDTDKRKEDCALSQDKTKPNDLKKAPSDHAELHQPCISTDFFTKVNDQIQNKLKINFVDGTPYLRNAVNTTVDLLCGRVQEYTVNTLLKMGSFESKREVRSKFLNMEEEEDVERVKSQVLIHANLLAEKISSDIRYAFFQLGERMCKKDLPQLMTFLTSCDDEQSRNLVIHIAEEIMVQRLQEWARVQLGPDFFRRIIIREAEKCSRTNSKPVSMFPTDFMQKLEQSEVDLDLKDEFSDLQQLSEIMDRALSCGVWYINSLTPGPRPDESFMLTLINDLISCIDKRMVTIDFAFYVMANFLMHLIIQYIMDAPYNWSETCIEAFIKLCKLCEDRKSEDDHLNIRLAETVRKTKNVKVKIYNLVSVFSLQWISKSLILDHTLMVYCQTLARLVEVGLMMVETLIHKLMKVRTNRHLMDSHRVTVDRVMLKVLSLLYAAGCLSETSSPTRVVSLILCLKLKLEEWGSEQLLADLNAAFGRLIED